MLPKFPSKFPNDTHKIFIIHYSIIMEKTGNINFLKEGFFGTWFVGS